MTDLAMSDRVFDRIEAALRIARDPRTIKADRDAAVAGAERMIANHGLNRADFQFPGEAKAAPPPRSRFREDLFERAHSPFFTGTWTDDDLADVLRRHQEEMRRYHERYTASADAMHRAYERREEEVRREQERGPRSRAKDRAELAAEWLWSLKPPVRIYPWCNVPSRLWIIPDESALEYSDEGVVEVAEARGWDGIERQAGGATIRTGNFGGELARIDRAVAFLRAKGIEVEPAASPGYWRVGFERDPVDGRRVILSARLRGFEA